MTDDHVEKSNPSTSRLRSSPFMTTMSRRAAPRLAAVSAVAATVCDGRTAFVQEATPPRAAPPQDVLPANSDDGMGQTVPINGVEIDSEVCGAGTPALLLHGGLASGGQGVSVIPRIADAGYKEESVDLNQTKSMSCLVPGAELAIMPDTGRFALFEQPVEFARIVVDFLRA